MSDENNIENNEEQNVELKSDLKSERKTLFDKIIIFFVILCCIVVLVKFLNISFFKTIEGYRENELDKGQWIVAEDEMDKPRSPATANLLPDGNVLIMGGENWSVDTAEIFDPNQMKIIKSIPLDDKRFCCYAATTLKNGDVFISGGLLYDSNRKKFPPSTNTTKIFNSKTYTFKDALPMDHPMTGQKHILLQNGHVLIFPPYPTKIDIHQIYNPEKNEYYKGNGDIPNGSSKFHFNFDNGDAIVFKFKQYLYKIKENKFEEYEKIPTEQLKIQLNSESYLCIRPEENYSTGYVYNIKTKEKTPVKNSINKTWRTQFPNIILLENGNVLILGVYAKTRKLKDKKYDKYSAYIYDRKRNIFYEIPAPTYPVFNAGIVKLQNGDILVAGGYYKEKSKRRASHSNKIQIYRYKH